MILALQLSLLGVVAILAAGLWAFVIAIQHATAGLWAIERAAEAHRVSTQASLKRIECSFDALTHQIQCK